MRLTSSYVLCWQCHHVDRRGECLCPCVCACVRGEKERGPRQPRAVSSAGTNQQACPSPCRSSNGRNKTSSLNASERASLVRKSVSSTPTTRGWARARRVRDRVLTWSSLACRLPSCERVWAGRVSCPSERGKGELGAWVASSLTLTPPEPLHDGTPGCVSMRSAAPHTRPTP